MSHTISEGLSLSKPVCRYGETPFDKLRATDPGDEATPPIIARARSLVGTRFRLHGRDPATGLDCIGLVLAAAGCRARVPDDYRLRGHGVAELRVYALAAGFREAERARAGAVVIVDCGHGQLHVALLAAASHIHAHAGLGRIVETPGWPEDMRAVLLPPA